MAGDPARTPTHNPRSICQTLLFAATGVAVLLALDGVLSVVGSVERSRIRDLESVQLLRRVAELADLNLFAVLPAVVNRPFALGSFETGVAFAGLAMVANLLLTLSAIVVVAPLAVLLQLMSRRIPERMSAWFWGTAFPLGGLVLLAGPIYVARIHDVLAGQRTALLATTAATALGLWGVLLLLLRDPARVRRLVFWTGAGGLGTILLTLLAGLVSGGFRAGVDSRPTPSRALPNILLVSIDTLRADHLHCYGYDRETSPRIDSLASEGALFETAVSPSSWTLPSHMTLLTSLPPEGHGLFDDGRRVGEDVELLSEVLWAAGYATAGFVAGPYLNATYGFLQGFDHYDDYSIARMSGRTASSIVTSPTSIGLTTDWLADWERRGRERPFFVFLHLWDVHSDFMPPAPYDEMFDPDYDGSITSEDFTRNERIHREMDPRDLEHIIALYDGEIRFTDHHLGKLLDRLSEMGVLDETIVVVTSDHGEEFFEHGRKGHRKNLYDETILIPLVIRYPARVPAGLRIDRQVRLMDVAPTVLGLAGLEQSEGFGGLPGGGLLAPQDLSSMFDPRNAENLEGLPAFSDLEGELKAVRTRTGKLIRSLAGEGSLEVFDLVSDPGEGDDLSEGEPPFAVTLDRSLEVWRDLWARRRILSEATEVDESIESQLRDLGYVE